MKKQESEANLSIYKAIPQRIELDAKWIRKTAAKETDSLAAKLDLLMLWVSDNALDKEMVFRLLLTFCASCASLIEVLN